MNVNYPLFIAPEHLAVKGRDHWNAKEAKEYREWMLSVSEKRIQDMVEILAEPFQAHHTPSLHLLALGEKIAELVKTEPFSIETHRPAIVSKGRTLVEARYERILSNSGYAISADIGLLVAKYLFESAPGKIRWETLRKSKKQWGYNMPVIVGFTKPFADYLDPVGGSIGEACGILLGVKGPETWKLSYEQWLRSVE